MSPPAKPEPTRIQRQRPTLKVTCIKPPPSTVTKERYLNYLANCSESWEVASVEHVVECMRKFPTARLHISNLSSVSAVNELLKVKDQLPNLTIETCGIYLYFTDRDIPDGYTLLKAYPPIRNSSNCNYLWECLKLCTINIVSSGHVSTDLSVKFLEEGSFKKAVSGVNSLGHSL
jgi:dihydroorotase-like cyclic amidohydrolase